MFISANRLLHDFHCVLECLNWQAEVIQNLILILKPCRHLMFKLLAQNKELSESLSLKLLNVLVLLIQQAKRVILEFS